MIVIIDGIEYDAYATVAFADTYLNAHPVYHSLWGAADANAKGRALVAATRMLQTIVFAEPPDIADPPLALQEAASLLAGAILARPQISGAQKTEEASLKRVKAGPVEVEFASAFTTGSGGALPDDVIAVLVSGGLLGGGTGGEDVPQVFLPERDTYFRLEGYYGNPRLWD